MSSSATKSSMNAGSRRRSNQPRLRCWCNEFSPLYISKSIDHEGKRFWGCPNYKIDKDGNNSDGGDAKNNSDVGDVKKNNCGDRGEVISLKKNNCDGGEVISLKKNNCDGADGLIKWIVVLLQMIVGLLVGIALILMFLVFMLY